MNENSLLKLSLIFALIGILTIFYISETTTVNISKILDLSKDNLDQKVRIKGEINSMGESPGLIILNIKDQTGTITTILFKDNSTINLERNQIIDITGTLTEYKNELEIIADQIIG
jgi:DNA/RNA endonuclease YhcR with UshA esterase domain